MSRNSYSAHHYSSLRSGDYDDEEKNATSSSVLTFADKRFAEQDSSLEALGKSVSRLGDLSLTISKEIDTQNRLLNTLDMDVERAQADTDDLMKRTKELVKKSGGTKIFCTIVVLSVVLVLLFLLVLYT
mmetsp:Transcript_10217/g.17092  ORF Transcript_10217/g.17092 Transcript_10217/m.17092 type:complete len:129 (+) Transcript_10217:101-487(+)